MGDREKTLITFSCTSKMFGWTYLLHGIAICLSRKHVVGLDADVELNVVDGRGWRRISIASIHPPVGVRVGVLLRAGASQSQTVARPAPRDQSQIEEESYRVPIEYAPLVQGDDVHDEGAGSGVVQRAHLREEHEEEGLPFGHGGSAAARPPRPTTVSLGGVVTQFADTAVALLNTEAVYLAKTVSKDIGARGEGRSKSVFDTSLALAARAPGNALDDAVDADATPNLSLSLCDMSLSCAATARPPPKGQRDPPRRRPECSHHDVQFLSGIAIRRSPSWPWAGGGGRFNDDFVGRRRDRVLVGTCCALAQSRIGGRTTTTPPDLHRRGA